MEFLKSDINPLMGREKKDVVSSFVVKYVSLLVDSEQGVLVVNLSVACW